MRRDAMADGDESSRVHQHAGSTGRALSAPVGALVKPVSKGRLKPEAADLGS